MHLGITQWRCLHRVLRKYINNTKSLVKLFFPSVCGCLWVLSSHARHLCFSRLQKKNVVSRLHLSIYLFVCSKENVVSCLHLYIFSSIPKKCSFHYLTYKEWKNEHYSAIHHNSFLDCRAMQCNSIYKD